MAYLTRESWWQSVWSWWKGLFPGPPPPRDASRARRAHWYLQHTLVTCNLLGLAMLLMYCLYLLWHSSAVMTSLGASGGSVGTSAAAAVADPDGSGTTLS